MPYILIFKNKIQRVNKIYDYIGKIEVETIDCRKKVGFERYKALFPHRVIEKKRISKRITIKPKIIPLKHFLDPESNPKVKRLKKRPYKRLYNPANPEDVEQFNLTEIDELAFKGNDGYTGSLHHLFLGAELIYFDMLQEKRGFHPQPGYCSFADIFKLEIARTKLDMSDITKFLKKLQNWYELQVECGIEQKSFPSYSYYLKILNLIGPDGILDYFLLLQRKCQLWNLYDDKIDVWDGRFLHGYESPLNYEKSDEKQIDDRGVYVHDNKYHGIGYLESRFINYRFRLPKFYFVINPRFNDNQTFLETFYSMIENKIPLAKIILADGGPKSKKVKEKIAFFRSIPIIAGPKNASGNIIVTEKNRYFYADHIPEKYWLILDEIFDIRTNVEQSFGYDFKTYGVENLERIGYKAVSQYIGIINCLALLNAIAGVITNQIDLITSPKAFRGFSLAKSGKSLVEIELSKIPPNSEKKVSMTLNIESSFGQQ